jgi:mannan endo-1,4-beta-mannosidase
MSFGKTITAASITLSLVALFCALTATRAIAQIPNNDEFVLHDGARLTLGGETFRFSGPNIEWLGLVSYGVFDPLGTRYPSHFEVDDALDTAKAMGARVIRSQTLGDSVGCDLCIEPRPGEFNPEAFAHIDYAVKAAHDRGLRLIVTLIGDCTDCVNAGIGQYVEWTGSKNMSDFFTDPKLIAMFEKHISALLNHKSTLTGIALKDDPAILAWENCNMCGLFGMMAAPGAGPAPITNWVDTIGAYVKSIDNKHLYQDNNGLFVFDKTGAALDVKTPDIITSEYYPHWEVALAAVLKFLEKTDAKTFPKHAAMITAKGKVYIVNELGWDTTNWPTQDDLQTVPKTFESDPKISGDLYWALQAHNIDFGWQPVPDNIPNAAYDKVGESGQWWALYYGGINTLINTKEDMAARAELLRSHAYRMAGLAVPPHDIPPAPVITVTGFGALGWRGSPGAVKYTVERKDSDSGPWQVVCDKCVTDSDAPWIDPKPAGMLVHTKYRVTAWNADGKSSAPSAER